jgi:hypothetical protein
MGGAGPLLEQVEDGLIRSGQACVRTLRGSGIAANSGSQRTVVHDGCAAPDLEFGGIDVPGAAVHAAFMAALADGYADLTSAAELLASG